VNALLHSPSSYKFRGVSSGFRSRERGTQAGSGFPGTGTRAGSPFPRTGNAKTYAGSGFPRTGNACGFPVLRNSERGITCGFPVPRNAERVWVCRSYEPEILYTFSCMETEDHMRVFVFSNSVCVPLFQNRSLFLVLSVFLEKNSRIRTIHQGSGVSFGFRS
jgi:hypothetical protein